MEKYSHNLYRCGRRQQGIGSNKSRRERHNIIAGLTEDRVGEIEEFALPLLVRIFDVFSIPATFAIRGQLTEVENSGLDILLKSSIKHDIGAHGYYHRKFTSLSEKEAEYELDLISNGMQKFGLVPRIFVFPANCVAHLNLLEKHNYRCYRSRGGFRKDSMCIEKRGCLYNIHPSLFIDHHAKYAFLQRILDISIKYQSLFHIWFHLWKRAHYRGKLDYLRSSAQNY